MPDDGRVSQTTRETGVADAFEIFTDDRNRLHLRRPGLADVEDVRIRRAFPWSSADRFISIRSSEGRELLMLDDLSQAPPEQRQIIQQALDRSSFIPKILRVLSIDDSFYHHHWKVITDHGPAEFQVQEREDIRFLSDGRFTIKDADGMIYELARLDQIDPRSRRILDRLL
jgi:hypothetical protein